MKPKKILIAEDDKLIRKAYVSALTAAGFAVITAENGRTALELISKEKPDLVLLDVVMPEKNGFEVAAEIKRKKWNIAVVITSNLGQDADIKKGRELGVRDYLLKSNFSAKDLIKKVHRYFNAVPRPAAKK